MAEEDSESITPARNAPIAIESPLISIKRAEPNTTSKAAAVIISRTLALEITRKIGFISHFPLATKIRTATRLRPIADQLVLDSASDLVRSKKGNRG